MSRTPYLDLNIPDKSSKGFVVTDVFEPNFTKLDQEAERVNSRKMSTEDNIEELKKANRYKLEDVVEVLGFHAKGDGSHHKRVAKAEDDGSGELGQNGIWWCVVHSGEVNVSWFGAKGDGVTDDTDILQKSIKFSSVNKVKVILDKKRYASKMLSFREGTTRFDYAQLIGNSKCLEPRISINYIGEDGDYFIYFNKSEFDGDPTLRGVVLENIELRNPNKKNVKYGMYAVGMTFARFDNVSVHNFGIGFLTAFTWNCSYKNLELVRSDIHGLSMPHLLGNTNTAIFENLHVTAGLAEPFPDYKGHIHVGGANSITFLNPVLEGLVKGNDGKQLNTPAFSIETVNGIEIINPHIEGTTCLIRNDDQSGGRSIPYNKIQVRGGIMMFNDDLDTSNSRFIDVKDRPSYASDKHYFDFINIDGLTITGIVRTKEWFDMSYVNNAKINVRFNPSWAIGGITNEQAYYRFYNFGRKVNQLTKNGNFIEGVITDQRGYFGRKYTGVQEFEMSFDNYSRVTNTAEFKLDNIFDGIKSIKVEVETKDISYADMLESSEFVLLIAENGNVNKHTKYINAKSTGRHEFTATYEVASSKLTLTCPHNLSSCSYKFKVSFTRANTYSLLGFMEEHEELVQQEGIYDDYVAYRDELQECENSQTTDETMLLPVLHEPIIPESVKAFAEKYNLI
ncbi:MAG: hypothetical protein ACRCX2_31840 [Paraclostridium sp.]